MRGLGDFLTNDFGSKVVDQFACQHFRSIHGRNLLAVTVCAGTQHRQPRFWQPARITLCELHITHNNTQPSMNKLVE